MYSVVLIAAMATTAPTPGWHFRSHCHCSAPVYSCHSCHGCHGPVVQGYGWDAAINPLEDAIARNRSTCHAFLVLASYA